jgi:hypothetical protein
MISLAEAMRNPQLLGDVFAAPSFWHRAALAADWGKMLSAGEQGVVVLIGSDKKQAKILKRYCRGLLENRMLAKKVVRSTEEGIEFKNGAALEVVTNDADLVRGRSVLGFLGNPDAASNDEEVVGGR